MRSALVTGSSTGIGRADRAAARPGRLARLRRCAPAGGRGVVAGGGLGAADASDARRDRPARRSRLRRSRLRVRGRRRPRRAGQQRRDRRAQPAGDAADRGLSPPDRGQPRRSGRRDPGDAAADPQGARPHRLHQLDRRTHCLPAGRCLPRRQVRDRGGRGRFRQELRPWGISVSIVEPGSIDTPIWERGEQEIDAIAERAPDREQLYGSAMSRYRKASKGLAERGIPPTKVAETIEHALSAHRPRTRYLVGARCQGPGAGQGHHAGAALRSHRRSHPGNLTQAPRSVPPILAVNRLTGQSTRTQGNICAQRLYSSTRPTTRGGT